MTLTADRLFKDHFWPLYPRERSLKDVRSVDANPAGNARLFEGLGAIAEVFARHGAALLDAPELTLDYSDASVHHLAANLTRERRDALLARERGDGELSDIVKLVTHGAVYLGECVVRQHGGFWTMRNPLWESRVILESRAGTGELSVFQWWLKALSDEEIDEPRLADRYRLNVEVPTMTPEELPVIAPPDRKLPTLKKVRYDALHKYLRAHLPELRDVGDHFPSAARLDEMNFQQLQFLLLGEGRMLLMYGPTDTGFHMFWLSLSGFVCSAFYPSDAFPAPVVKTEGEKIQVHLSILNQRQMHEMLWWGPTQS